MYITWIKFHISFVKFLFGHFTQNYVEIMTDDFIQVVQIRENLCLVFRHCHYTLLTYFTMSIVRTAVHDIATWYTILPQLNSEPLSGSGFEKAYIFILTVSLWNGLLSLRSTRIRASYFLYIIHSVLKILVIRTIISSVMSFCRQPLSLILGHLQLIFARFVPKVFSGYFLHVRIKRRRRGVFNRDAEKF